MPAKYKPMNQLLKISRVDFTGETGQSFKFIERKTMKRTQLLTAGFIGLVIGFLIGREIPNRVNEYSLQPINNAAFDTKAVKMDNKTGETWIMDNRGIWRKGTNSN